MITLDALAERIERQAKALERLVEQIAHGGPSPMALKRAAAAKMMGVSVGKLDVLVRAGKVKTAEDPHLIPMVEIRRYCAPKATRQRKPAVGMRALRMKHSDSQSDEAWDDATKRLRAKARSG